MKGGPIEVGGHFQCDSNQLTSLKGGPYKISGDIYYCHNNQITGLDGFPVIHREKVDVGLIDNPVSEIYELFGGFLNVKAIDELIE